MYRKVDNNRIAFVLGGMSNGGAERVVSLIANYYARKGKKVDILTLLSSKCTYELESNVRLISMANEKKTRKFQVLDWVVGIKKYYKTNRPYCIVSFFAKINIIVLLSLLGNMQDIIVSERNDPARDGRGKLVKILTSTLYPLTKRVIFQTKWAQSCFNKKVISNSEIIQNPVTEIKLSPMKKEKTIINVGKLSSQKNHKLLINAFAKIADDYPDYNLCIYGEGELRGQLEELINTLGLNNRVHLPGWISNIHNKMAESELFVLSSDYEGLSNALLEAMMIGIPCISTDCAGSNEVISNKYNGLLVLKNDIDDLAKKMRFMLENPELARSMGKQAERDVRQYGVSKIIYKWESIIG
ncbi:glycosyltransferase family 4 protein [Ralstonia pickettii]|nr:glycosyltransferase family 4 protein [Ralstonia pickettii]